MMLAALLCAVAMGQVPSQDPFLTGRPFTQKGDLDRRLPYRDSHRTNLHWEATVELFSGRAGGLVFWADEKLENGYVVRLDARLGRLILAKIGPWPNEERLAEFPWGPLEGSKARLQISANEGRIRIKRGTEWYALLEAHGQKPFGTWLGFHVLDGDATFSQYSRVGASGIDFPIRVPKVGEFKHVFDQSVGEKGKWYINDHCFLYTSAGWHLFGITHAKPANPMDERHFAHATSPSLDKVPWKKEAFALSWDPKAGENHLWAPHVIQKAGLYYMFYCAGSLESNYQYRIHLATSKDLKTWTRHGKNPLFQDFFDARDPMVLQVDGTYYMYYTANLDKERNHHVVNVRTSKNLLDWSPAKVAFVHSARGTFGGPTESPFVVRHQSHFYLFIGPDGNYRTTKVYRSANPLYWEEKPVYSFPSHAAEVLMDPKGNWFVSNCGWDMDGVYLAPMTWEASQ